MVVGIIAWEAKGKHYHSQNTRKHICKEKVSAPTRQKSRNSEADKPPEIDQPQIPHRSYHLASRETGRETKWS